MNQPDKNEGSKCPYPYGHYKCDMSYQCYLECMKDYGFYPLNENLWREWREHATRRLT